MKKMFLAIFEECKRSYMIAILVTVFLYVIFSRFNLLPDMVEKFWGNYGFFFSNTVTLVSIVIGIYTYVFLYNIRRIRIGWKKSEHMKSEELYPYLFGSFFIGMLILISVVIVRHEIIYVFVFLFTNVVLIAIHTKIQSFVRRQLSVNDAHIGILRGKRALICGSLLVGFPILLLSIEGGIIVSCMIYLFTWAFYYGPST